MIFEEAAPAIALEWGMLDSCDAPKLRMTSSSRRPEAASDTRWDCKE